MATFNIAGVPGLLVKGLRQKGIGADLVVSLRHPYGFPYETVIEGRGTKFLRRILSMSQGYSIVHVHGLLYRFCADILTLKTLKRRVVLHFHGTELRQAYKLTSVRFAQRISDEVIVSTPDLLAYGIRAKWLPNPIDPVFKPLNSRARQGKALYFRKGYEAEMEKMVRQKCAEMGLKLTVPSSFVPYSEMPYFLNQFEVFFDRFAIPSLSKTALEALASGCKVMSWKGLVKNPEKMLQNHSLEVVTEKLMNVYEGVLID